MTAVDPANIVIKPINVVARIKDGTKTTQENDSYRNVDIDERHLETDGSRDSRDDAPGHITAPVESQRSSSMTHFGRKTSKPKLVKQSVPLSQIPILVVNE